MCMLIPLAVNDAGVTHCLATAPTLVMSVMFIILYLVDQMHDLAEQLYLVLQIKLNIVALIEAIHNSAPSQILYALFYCHLLFALCLDQYFIYKERGFVLSWILKAFVE